MERYTEKLRSVDVIEPGQQMVIRWGTSECACTVRKVLSDGIALKISVICDADPDQAPPAVPGLVVNGSFSRRHAGRSHFFAFESKVLGSAPEESSSQVLVTIAMPDSVTRIEKRSRLRVGISVSGILRPERSDSQDVLFVTKNMSAGGACIVGSVPLQAGMKGVIELDIPDAGLPPLMAEVTRSSRGDGGEWVSSLRFVNLDPELEDRLFNLIREWDKGLKAFTKRRLLLPLRLFGR